MSNEPNRQAPGEVLPCPFCKGKLRVGDIKSPGEADGWIVTGYRASCSECHISMSEKPTTAEAIAAWNRRAALEPVAVQPGELDRKAIAAAIFDPGATEGDKGARTLSGWQTDAVMRVLSALVPSAPAPVEGVEQFGMIDEASGHEPLYFGRVNGIEPWGVSGDRYVKLSDYERLTAERDEARADHEWMTANRNKWQDAATIARRRTETAEAEVARLTATQDAKDKAYWAVAEQCANLETDVARLTGLLAEADSLDIDGEVSAAEIEWSYRDDDHRYPREFWHARINWRGFTSDWDCYGEQEQRELPSDVKEQAETELREGLRNSFRTARRYQQKWETK